MTKKTILLFITILSYNFILAQINLLPNPSFEFHKTKTTSSSMVDCYNWYDPNGFSSDHLSSKYDKELYMELYKKQFDQETNKIFKYKLDSNCYFYKPRTGDCCVGLYLFASKIFYSNNRPYNEYDYREYISVKLNKGLKAGAKYHIGFYILLDKCHTQYAYTSDIGLFFSPDSATLTTDFERTTITRVYNKAENFITDNENWHLIEGFFSANGTERFLTIGNFTKPNEANYFIDFEGIEQYLITHNYAMRNKKLSLDNLEKSLFNAQAYVYMDDFFLYEIKDTLKYIDSAKQAYKMAFQELDSLNKVTINNLKRLEFDKIEKQKNVQFRRLSFETNSAIILPKSLPELNNLASYLRKNSKVKIKIMGHTDNVGKEKANQKLSEQRAKAVADYLIKSGVQSNRITSEGFGSKAPIDSSNTEAAKVKNRRVEFTFE